jgi:peptidoglycan/LPS O-acetylase OafA/YrhL
MRCYAAGNMTLLSFASDTPDPTLIRRIAVGVTILAMGYVTVRLMRTPRHLRRRWLVTLAGLVACIGAFLCAATLTFVEHSAYLRDGGLLGSVLAFVIAGALVRRAPH